MRITLIHIPIKAENAASQSFSITKRKNSNTTPTPNNKTKSSGGIAEKLPLNALVRVGIAELCKHSIAKPPNRAVRNLVDGLRLSSVVRFFNRFRLSIFDWKLTFSFKSSFVTVTAKNHYGS